jgi:hypothetical protein
LGILDFSRLKRRPDSPYMTRGERKIFEDQVESGAITFFRIIKCSVKSCKREIPRSKKYCSKECFEHAESRKKAKDK